MQLILGKLGKTTYLCRDKFSPSGGDYEPALFFPLLAKYSPQHTFYYASKLNFSGLTQEEKERALPKNLINIWEERLPGENQEVFIERYFSDKKIDGGIVFNGPVGAANVPGAVLSAKTGEPCGILNMFGMYAAPIIHAMNVTKAPWLRMTTDARFLECEPYDMLNMPKWNYSMNALDIEYDVKRVKAYGLSTAPENLVTEHIHHKYMPCEKLFFLNIDPVDARQFKKDIRILFILNQMKANNVRFKMLDEYFFTRKEDFILHGKWDEATMAKDARFLGAIPFAQLQEKLKRAKYSMMMPFSQAWCTAKVYEVAHKGVLPFFHPEYDTTKAFPVPEYLRTKSANDFYAKCEELDRREDLYREIFEETQALLRPDLYDGSEFAERIMRHFDPQYQVTIPGKEKDTMTDFWR